MGSSLSLTQVYSGLTSPLVLIEDHQHHLLIADQIGLIHIFDSQTFKSSIFLDLRSKVVDLSPNYDERGLLGLALSPNYASTGKFYVYYSRRSSPGDSVK